MAAFKLQTPVSVESDASSASARWLWAILLISGSVLLSAKFSCATPFAALATLAALDMKRADGLLLVLAVWAANQLVGYGFLGYPHELQSYGWGLAVGAAAVAAYVVARIAAGGVSRFGLVAAMVAALSAAFVAYELVLLAATLILPSSDDAFAWPVVGQIAQVNAIAFVALMLLHRLISMSGVLPPISAERLIALAPKRGRPEDQASPPPRG